MFLFSFLAGLSPLDAQDRDSLLIEDFESGSYHRWTITGEAFGDAPAEGTLARQNPVSGYRGTGLVNTFRGGDGTTGEATSQPFRIERPYLAFLIGGGADRSNVGLELRVDNQPVRAASGRDNEELEWSWWDVRDLMGREATLRIYDDATGGWGHINVDHIVQTSAPPKRFDLEHQLQQYRRSDDYLNEPLRPQFHFSPEINWMNDPNGLVYFDGEYHLFYQFNPAGTSWGHMSWGHAVSDDLVHWEHLPLAIPEEDGVMAFSGCCVVDTENTSGFGKGDQPPMVAIYTGHGHGKQVQNVAYSNDRGRTWTKYDGNPVLDIGERDFRDPKVFWHEPSRQWVMVVSLAAEKVLVFYGSQDLKDWKELSRFGPAGNAGKPNWECPDLFKLPVENEPGQELWVLEADMGNGSIAGGSGGEYFVGHFDGSRFETIQDAQWVDFGRDFYAPISWSDIPESDGRRIWIGWFNNWQTCLVPTSPWRSCMSVPRSLSLRRVTDEGGGDRYVLIQRPVVELQEQRDAAQRLDVGSATWPPRAIELEEPLGDRAFELNLKILPGDARSAGVRVRTGEDEFTEIGYDREPGVVYVDRTRSGIVDFHEAFPGRHEAPARVISGEVHLQILVDRSTVEVFINDGEAVISDRIFPRGKVAEFEFFRGDDSAKIEDVILYPLKSSWR